MIESPNDFLLKQVHFATSTKIGPHVIFDDDPDGIYCPYCGKQLITSMSNEYSMSCNCSEYKKDLDTLSKINEINDEINNLVLKKKEMTDKMNENVKNAGMKLCAKHYIEHKKDRDYFESKIAEYAN